MFTSLKQSVLVCAAVISVLGLTSCGNGINFNKVWGDDEGLDSLIAQAKIYYDKGEFEKAETFAKKAYDINNENEEAAVILGYIHLSLGGIDPFVLAQKLVCMGNNNNDASKCSGDAATALTYDGFESFLNDAVQTAGTSTTSTSGDTSASSSVNQLGDVMSALISLSDADKTLLGIDKSATDTSSFAEFNIPVYSPTVVTEELRSKIPTLNAMNQSIKYVCPFVASAVLSAGAGGDPRDAACVSSTKPKKQMAKAHFLWAFTHMTEAVIFQSVLLFSSAAGSTSNLEARSKKLNEFTDVTKFVNAVKDLEANVAAVFATPGEGAVTQLSATVNALTSVSNAFGELAGLPDSMKAQITKSITNLKELGSKVSSATNAVSGQSTALKAQMTEKMASSLKTTIDSKCATATTCSAEDTKKLCDSYTAITLGADATKVTKPTACGT